MSSKNMTAINSMTQHGHATHVKSSPPINNSLESNGVAKSSQRDSYNYSSLKQTLTKSQSTASLSAIQGSKFQDNYKLARQGSPRPISRSRENLVTKGGGRSTIGHEPGFRDRLPSFTVRQQPPAAELQTHFAVYKFVPRHQNEVVLNVGDAVYVKVVHEDLWCEGRNLRTGESGIFPNRYVSDILSHAGTKFGE